MNYFALTSIAVSLVFIAAAWRGIADARRSRFRSDLFAMRDDLFDFMLDNNLDFNHHLYRQVRDMLNGTVRWSDELSLPVIKSCTVYYLQNKAAQQFADDLQQQRHQLIGKKCSEVFATATARTCQFLFLEGFLGIVVRLLFPVLNLSLGATQHIERMKNRVSNTLLVAQDFPGHKTGHSLA